MSSHSKPVLIAAAVVETNKETEEHTYSNEEWLYYLAQADAQHYALENPDHPTVNSYVLSLVIKGKGKRFWGSPKGTCKDKGKGKGKDAAGKGPAPKGKGKGFQGSCWTCGTVGHSSRNCPKNQQANLTRDQQTHSTQNDWYHVALLCTENHRP